MNRPNTAMMPILSGLLLCAAPLGAQESASARPAAREIAARTGPAVVSIRAMVDGREVSSGSGFVLRGDGVIVTNFHVVEDATSLEVELATGEVFTNVYVLGTDDRRDIAVLKLPTTRLPALEPGDANALAVGDPVYVMGNPLGLDRTFSNGMVSARRVMDGVAYLQISAPISPGSSGGPVLDEDGRVIGVATATLSEGQNLNLAVPMSYAEGLLGIAGAPEPFEQVAARWAHAPAAAVAPAGPAAATAPAPATPAERPDAELAGLEAWQAVVVQQLRSAEERMVEVGYGAFEAALYDLLSADSVDTATADLPSGEYRAIAVCDNDCSDVDLMVTDEGGEVLGMDVLDDDVPIVDFKTPGGRVGLSVKMIRCETNVCYYGVQLFRKK
ncbi:MAG TPA: trypsin-like peptidase domain-containing protein [Longimicrobiales bacterium]|nr:trypsin-like peptidase domain-containing protein [Longimicrobiales bacterium]